MNQNAYKNLLCWYLLNCEIGTVFFYYEFILLIGISSNFRRQLWHLICPCQRYGSILVNSWSNMWQVNLYNILFCRHMKLNFISFPEHCSNQKGFSNIVMKFARMFQGFNYLTYYIWDFVCFTKEKCICNLMSFLGLNKSW